MIVAVIPLKRLEDAKSRLAPHLSHAERGDLMRRLTQRTVEALQRCPAIARIALATPETDLARTLRVVHIADRGSLNGAIEDAQAWAGALHSDTLLVVPADLPRLSSKDIDALLQAAPPAPSLTIAPTRDGGTGGMLLSPPYMIEPAFGPNSFALHRNRADAAGAEVQVVLRDGFAADLDTIEDLKMHRLHFP